MAEGKDAAAPKDAAPPVHSFAHEIALPNPVLYLDKLATVSGDMLGNTPKPTDIDGLFISGMRHVQQLQWAKAHALLQQALEKASKACKVKKPSKADVEKLATICMVQGFVAANENQPPRCLNLYQKSVQYWTALHGKDSDTLAPLKADLEKIKAKVGKEGKEGKGGGEGKGDLDDSRHAEAEQPDSPASPASPASPPIAAAAPAAAAASSASASAPPS
jgi:hypothetical protein